MGLLMVSLARLSGPVFWDRPARSLGRSPVTVPSGTGPIISIRVPCHTTARPRRLRSRSIGRSLDTSLSHESIAALRQGCREDGRRSFRNSKAPLGLRGDPVPIRKSTFHGG
ncbi:hypothetical protein KM043_016166 [Ampulex compressa]|nr:hypothetical protein KM043_016166 [Ampulex compressa]